MGMILSRVRKKKSAVETLEKLENDIKEIEESRTNAQLRHRRVTKLFLVYSFILYVLCGIVFYFHFTSTLKGKLLYLVPLALSPLLLYVVKRIISWYYVRLINKNQLRLKEMKNEKKRILDEVMNKETYKVAKEILDKYSTESVPKSNPSLMLAPSKQPDEGIRKRIIPPSNTLRPQPPRNIIKGTYLNQPSQSITSSPMAIRTMQVARPPPMHLPAPILPLQRSYVDRVVEYLIGDGPNNRYALICSQCHSHNGMALKEEFEYIGFKCCYCYFFNPARKIRPEAPKLESVFKESQVSDSDSDSKTSENNFEERLSALLNNNKELQENSIDLEENTETTPPKNVNENVTPVSPDESTNKVSDELHKKEDSEINNEENELVVPKENDSNLVESEADCNRFSPKS